MEITNNAKPEAAAVQVPYAPVEEVIRLLDLKPLTVEGGMWAQGYVSDEMVPADQFEGRDTDRPLYGTIYFLITPDSFSCMHKLATDEVWYHHCGPALKLLLIWPDGRSEIRLLGQDLLKGERPQIAVPRGVWQGSLMDMPHDPRPDIYTLVSTSMAPAYQDRDFTAGTYDELKAYVPDEYENLLRKLTSEPVYR